MSTFIFCYFMFLTSVCGRPHSISTSKPSISFHCTMQDSTAPGLRKFLLASVLITFLFSYQLCYHFPINVLLFSLGNNYCKASTDRWLMTSEYNIDIYISNTYSLLPAKHLTVINSHWDRSGYYVARLDLKTAGPSCPLTDKKGCSHSITLH